jgi:DNA-binding transcriptional LysR family regulator
MNLDLIKSFSVLAATCHFGEAAQRLRISQPSLTKQIRRLEDLLGAPLFVRGRQGTALTAFGRQFLEDVQPVLRHADHVWENGIRAARGERGRLALGFTFSSVEVMSRALFRFHGIYPEVDIAFEDISSRHQLDRIREGSLDAGFARLPVDGEDLAFQVVARDRLAFVMPYSLAATISGFDDIAVRDLPFLALRPAFAPGLEAYVQRLFKSRGFQPRIIHRVNESLTLVSLIASGLGVALMHESALTRVINNVNGVAVRPVEDPVSTWQVGLVWRTDSDNPVFDRFRKVVNETLATG